MSCVMCHVSCHVITHNILLYMFCFLRLLPRIIQASDIPTPSDARDRVPERSTPTRVSRSCKREQARREREDEEKREEGHQGEQHYVIIHYITYTTYIYIAHITYNM